MATQKGGYHTKDGVSELTLSRFMEKVEFIDPDECWIWVGCRHPRGYGQFWNGDKIVRAHRWIYESLLGPVSTDLVIDHLCRNTSCVNPRHLQEVTQRTNVLRGTAPAAHQARQTHCVHGHELIGENLYMKPNGARQCVPCRRETDRRRRGNR